MLLMDGSETNRPDQARADICIQGFKRQHSSTFLDVCVLSPVWQTNVSLSTNQLKLPKKEKTNVEGGTLVERWGKVGPLEGQER